MSKLSIFLGFAAALLPPANASTVIVDPFGGAATSCASASCDVIGNKLDFDIQKANVVITPGWSSVTLYMNYRNSTLSPYVLPRSGGGLKLNVSDIFLGINGSKYIIPLVSRNYTGSQNFTAGSIYKAGNGITSLTSNQALGLVNSSAELSHWTWRKNQPVWAGGNGAGKALTTGTVNISNYGNGTANALYAINVHFNTPLSWSIDPGENIAVQMASAICANDILTGNVEASAVPEPSSVLLFGTVAAVLGFAVSRRKLQSPRPRSTL